MQSRVITAEFIEFARGHFKLDWRGVHGAPHWSRVRHNGLFLAEHTGANPRVVELFAFIHDLCRENDYSDPDHGQRAADLALRLSGDGLVKVAHDELELLTEACARHSGGGLVGDVTVLTCWDADRLDLGRVGVSPDPDRLCTEAARERSFVSAAYRRSVR